MNNNVNIQEKTEVNGVFCPFIKGNCRIDCALFGGNAECALSRIHDFADAITETLEEASEINSGISEVKRLIEAFNYQEG